MRNNRSSSTETFLPFLGVHLRHGDGVPVYLVQTMAKAANRAWLAVPIDARMKIRRLWERSKSTGFTPVAVVQPTPAAEDYNPGMGLIFSEGRLRRMSPEELQAEASRHLARAALAADGVADRAGVEVLVKSWRGGYRGRGREAIVLPQIKSAAQRHLWGLPPLPPEFVEVVCPTLRDPARREKWGLPPL